MGERTFTESFKVAGNQLVDAVKQLIHEGNVRRVIIKHEGHTVVEFPLTIGVVGTVLAPVLAAVGGIAVILTECTVVVERAVSDEAATPNDAASGEKDDDVGNQKGAA
jgi:hypothetical protein